MTATNMTGIVIAVIIFSSLNIQGFFKPLFAIWIVACIVFFPFAIRVMSSKYPYKGQFVTAVLNVMVYGFILLRILTDYIKEKKYKSLSISVFAGWLVMLLTMLFSVNENIWPIWYAVVFGVYYLITFDKDCEKCIWQSIPDGIILGFFVIQGSALLFRPYDIARYSGLYVNPNFNALFYLMSYSAFLCKWYLLKKEGKYPVIRTFSCLFAASMYGFCVFTGSKTAILAMLVVTFPFSLLMLRYYKRGVISFAKCWLLLGFVGIISVPIIYIAIRYMPTLHLHPIYFEGEYSTSKIQPGEPKDSEKYITFELAMEENVGRVFYKFPKLREQIDSFMTLKVHAAELDVKQELEYIFTDEEVDAGIDPVEMRREIRKYYFDRLNWTGHTNDYDGAPVYTGNIEPHSHNVFIQMAFLYGIPAGIMFMFMVLAFVPVCIRLLKTGDDFRVCVISCFVISFVIFGFFEIDWMCGQLPFTMLFLLFRDVVRKTQNASVEAGVMHE